MKTDDYFLRRRPRWFQSTLLGPRRHPVIRTSAALAISRRSLLGIVSLYISAYAAVAALLTVGLISGRNEWGRFEFYPKYFLLLMMAPGNLIGSASETWGAYAVLYIAEVLRVVLPVFLLGAFVFKLFHVDPLRWRRSLSLESELGGEPAVLRVRFYNSTSSPLVNLRIQVFARVRTTGTPRAVMNVGLKVAQGEDPETKDAAFWALSRPGVPFTVNVPLGRGLTAKEVIEGRELVLPGRSEAVARDRVKLFVLASGTSMATGTSFSSGYEYDMSSDILLGHYGEIDVVYSAHPRTWRGWDQFEGNTDLFVFGYASLASPESVAQTVGHAVDSTSFSYAKLAGWSRNWSVGSDKSSHPERTFRMSDGSEFDGVSVVMGIESDAHKHCDGAVFPVSRGDLSILDIRERNYQRVDVTEQVTWAGKPAACVVYTYVPTAEAIERVAAAQKDNRPAVIRAGYLNLIRKAFEQEAFPRESRKEFESVPFTVVDLDVEIDESLVPVRQAMLASSYLQ